MWLYQDKEVTEIQDLGSDTYGFIYKIEDNKTGKIYIGKKILFTNRKKKLTKKELAEIEPKKGRKPTFKRDIQESNWKDYYGSSKTLLEEINKRGKLDFRREILRLCKTKKQLTYWELHFQCINQVLLIDSYNDNILSKFYRKDLID
jgi:hypothetical protein